MGVWERRVLWIVIAALVIFDLALVGGAYGLMREVIGEIRTALDELATQPITAEVHLDTEVPVSTTVPLRQQFTIPVATTYRLDTVVQTTVQIPILGPQAINIPVKGTVPLEMELTVPIEAEVPISFAYHLEMTVPVEVDLPDEAFAPLYATLERLERPWRLGP